MIPFLAVAAVAVALTAEDGRAVKGSWRSPAADAPIVILVADEGSTPDEWAPVAGALADARIATLAIGPRVAATARDTAKDVEAAIAWAKKRKDADPTRLLLAGAGNGALAALAAAGEHPEVDGVALVSAPIDRRRLDDEDALADFGARPLFVAVARSDKKPAKSALVLEANARGRKKLVITDGSRTGAELLSKSHDAQAAFLLWARQTLGLEPVPEETPRPTPQPKP